MPFFQLLFSGTKSMQQPPKPHRIHGIFTYIYHQNQHTIVPWIPWDRSMSLREPVFEVMAQYIWSRAIGLPIERPKSVPCRLNENFSVTSIRPTPDGTEMRKSLERA